MLTSRRTRGIFARHDEKRRDGNQAGCTNCRESWLLRPRYFRRYNAVILLLGPVAVLLGVLLRLWLRRQPLTVPTLNSSFLLVAAFLPQFLAFYLPATRQRLPDALAPIILVGSQLLLVGFAVANRDKPGFWLLGIGLALNFLVIVVNGGLMPISPETAGHITTLPNAWHVGGRFGPGKDLVINQGATRLWLLSDHLLLPDGLGFQVPYSIGDVLIALGAFWFLWKLPEGPPKRLTKGATIHALDR